MWTVVTQLAEIDSPALVVDLDVMEANLASMAALTGAHGIDLWPNIKGHKIPALAWRQMRAGAAGITCQKLAETEVMVDAGITDVLVAVQVIGASKVEQLRRLARRARLITVVDSLEGAQAIGDAFARNDQTIEAFLEIDIGYHRCGVSAADASGLARRISQVHGLKLVGVMGYEGHLYDLKGQAEVRAAARRSYDVLIGVSANLQSAGLDAPRVSVGASAGSDVAAEMEGITEVRAGSYLMNDRAQIAMGSADAASCAATVLATVISVPAATRAVIDAGAKALTATTIPGLPGYGTLVGHDDAVLERLSDEHGMIATALQNPFRIGERVQVIPNSHTVVFNQFAEVYTVRKGMVEAVLPVAARGMMQ
jgi:D-serine deaminase-like pyridoxal phosphate-dependent protein